MSLEKYLADQYNRDLQDVATIEKLLADVAATFINSYDSGKGCWPYQLTSGSLAVGKMSHGTSAMILSAIGKILGDGTMPNVTRTKILSEKQLELLKPIFTLGSRSLLKNLKDNGRVISGTFGDDNPITISHLTELYRGMRGTEFGKGLWSAITAASADKLLNSFISVSPTDVKKFSTALPTKTRNDWCTKNAFVALRIVRAKADLNDAHHFSAGLYKEFFENRLHEHLSFSSIPDSRFDPAELAFSLEGLLRCAREAVDPILFGRVLSVLAGQQETSAYWRPSRPFMAKPTGEIILPISVEGANSLLRSIEIIDGKELYGTFAAAAVPMFRRFWQWIRARKVELVLDGKVQVGWHSEHINETGAVHLWDSSQVVEFLISFRKLLHGHIARETLVLSRVKIEEPEVEDWQSVSEKYEPLSSGKFSERIFQLANEDFVQPWRKGVPVNYSMLLYGPPGTGKTNFAKSIANALTFRLVTVTVSDFLGAGGELVEARAKAIFQMLEAQSGCVILFDEIDAFLLDRDSEHYRRQGTLFQFLTPGMLTKFNDLRSKKQSIFIIATNFANRIDPAIKRPGRIDKQYLLLPPDFLKRKQIIQQLAGDTKLSPTNLTTMAQASLYLGYKEIEGAMSGVSGEKSDQAIIKNLKEAPRSSSDRNYLARLGQEAFPEKEFFAVANMAVEAGQLKELNGNIRSHKKLWKATIAKHRRHNDWHSRSTSCQIV